MHFALFLVSYDALLGTAHTYYIFSCPLLSGKYRDLCKPIILVLINYPQK